MDGSPREKGISRIDAGSTHSWFVRGYKNRKTYSKLFSDCKKGGKEKALEAAIVYRDKLFERIAVMPKVPRKRRVATRDSRNKTGVLGVCRTLKYDANGKVSEMYSVSWRPQANVQKCKSFSVRKYGEKKAFKMAVAHRKKMVGKVIYVNNND